VTFPDHIERVLTAYGVRADTKAALGSEAIRSKPTTSR